MRKNRWLKRNLAGVLCLILALSQGTNRITTAADVVAETSIEDSQGNSGEEKGEDEEEEKAARSADANIVITITNASLAETGTTLSDGNYRLGEDITLTEETGNITIEEAATVTLDLNGYILQGNGAGSVITNAGTLTIQDTGEQRAHKGSLENYAIPDGKTPIPGYVWKPDESGTEILYGGIITGGNYSTEVAARCYGIENKGALNLTSGTIAGCLNTAAKGNETDHVTGGAGIYTSGTVNFSGGRIAYCMAQTNYAASQTGGAGIVVSNGTLNFSGDARIDHCTAYFGGAVFLENSKSVNMVMTGGAIEGCYANEGGAIMAQPDTTFEMSGGVIKANTATGSGAGIRLRSTFTMNGGEILNNTAGVRAGGIYAQGGNVIIKAGTLSGNRCSSLGGAIYCDRSITIEENATISNNTAQLGGAICIEAMNTNAAAAVSGGTLSGNTATQDGGAICVRVSKSAKEGVIVSAAVSGGTLSGNTAAQNGGAIYVEKGSAAVSGGTLTENHASGSGGAIYVDASSGTEEAPVTVTIAGGTITSNTAAVNGGGVCIAGTGRSAKVVIGAESTEEGISGSPAITGNTAWGLGGGVYLENGTVIMKNGTIEGNYESGNLENDARQADGIWQQAGGTVTVKVTTGGTSVAGTIDETKSLTYYQLVYNSDASDAAPSVSQKITIVVAAEGEAAQSIKLSDTMFTRSNYSISGYQVKHTQFLFDYTEVESETTKKSTENLTLSKLISEAKGSDETLSGSGSSDDPYIITLTALWKNVEPSSYTVTIPADAALTYEKSESGNAKTIGTLEASITNFQASDRLIIKVYSQNKSLVLQGGKASIPVTYTFAAAGSAAIGDSSGDNITESGTDNKARYTTSGDVNNGGYAVALANGSGSVSDQTYYWRQELTATLGKDADITYAGTYTDTLTFTVSYKGH